MRRSILHSSRCFVFAMFCFLAMLYAGTKPSQQMPSTQQSPPDSQQIVPGTQQHTTQQQALRRGMMQGAGIDEIPDSVRGFQLEAVTTNSAISYAMPEDAMEVGTWHLTGAYEDVQRVNFESDCFQFPIGRHLLDSLWTYTWGKVRPQLRNTSNEIVVTGVPMSAIPNLSRFWMSETDKPSRLLTWENFVLGRVQKEELGFGLETNTLPLVSAQLELFSNGDFIARSNEVERVYRRTIETNPIDWNNPASATNEFISSRPFGPVQNLDWIDKPNAYCWVDILVSQADAWVTFTGDEWSYLSDPGFAAKAGETNRVTFLVGKTYRVTCDLPFQIVGKSDPEITESWEVPTTVVLKRPIEFVIRRPRETESPFLLSFNGLGSLGGNGFSVYTIPSGLGGYFTWTNSCSFLTDNEIDFYHQCYGGCSCGGCYASGYFNYEGYQVPVLGGSCGCGNPEPKDDNEESDSGGVSVYFTKPVVIFEDAYQDTPTTIVNRRSTTTTLCLSASGGEKGGIVLFTANGIDGRLDGGVHGFPIYRQLAPGENLVLSNVYAAVSASHGKDDIEVTGLFRENDTGWTDEANSKATSIKIQLKAVARTIDNPSDERHTYGVRELVECTQEPRNPRVSWNPSFGEMRSENEYCCPLMAKTNPLRITYSDAEYIPLISVIEPEYVEVLDVWYDDFSAPIGEAGSIALCLKMYIGPFHVSFTGIAVEEVPCERGNAGGYFNRPEMRNWCHHTREIGAGLWYNVTEGNKMGDQSVYDQAGITNTLLRVNEDGALTTNRVYRWADGWINIQNPFGWNDHNTNGFTDPFGLFAENTIDRIELRTDGCCNIKKLSKEVIRYTTGEVYLNGVLQE